MNSIYTTAYALHRPMRKASFPATRPAMETAQTPWASYSAPTLTPQFAGDAMKKSRMALLFQTALLAVAGFFLPGSQPVSKPQTEQAYSISRPNLNLLPTRSIDPSVLAGQRWGDHIRIQAASNGVERSYYNEKGGYYVQSVRDWFTKNPTGGFEEQQRSAVTEGYSARKGNKQFATQSVGALESWKVDDARQPVRFAVLLGQHEEYTEADYFGMDYDTAEWMHNYATGFNQAVEADIANMESILKDTYRLPEDQIFKLPNANKETVLSTLAKVHELIKKAKKDTGRPVELVVFYAGHGTAAEKLPETGDVAASDFEGLLGIGVSETDLKKALNPMTEARILVKLDCCHAGVFTAQHMPKPSTLSGKKALPA